MNIKEIYKRAIYYISVPKCVLCNEKLDYGDRGLCKSCIEEYKKHKERDCPKCAKILSKCFCTYEDLESHGIKNLVKIFRYSKSEQSMPSNYLIYSLKQDNRNDVMDFLADELADAIKNNIPEDLSEYVITNVPRRKAAIVNYGYDHAKALALRVSKKLGIEYTEILKSRSKSPQKSVYGHERIENAKFDYKCKKDYTLKGKSVIIVDDIITTGASMSNCATLIRGLRPKRIIGACLGTAYKESRADFNSSAFK